MPDQTGPEPRKPARDLWDILSVAGTLFSTVILGVLTILFSRQSEEVKTTLQTAQTSISKAQLVGNLIAYLQKNDEGQDIALIGLDRSIGDLKDPSGSDLLMVVQIANTVFTKRLNTNAAKLMSAKSTEDGSAPAPDGGGSTMTDPATLVAVQIMKERCAANSPALTRWCKNDFAAVQQRLAAAPLPNRKQVVSAVDAKPHQAAAVIAKAAASNAVATYLASAFSAVVYIQYNGDPAFAEGLRNALNTRNDATITTPAAEHLIGNYGDTVRYFHPEDGDIAKHIAELANEYAGKHQRNADFTAVDYGPRGDVPHGQVEIWIR